MIKRLFNFIKRIIHGFIGFFPWYIKLYKGRAWYTKICLGLVSFIVSIFLYLGMVDINFLGLFGKSPGFLEIKTPPTYAASEVYSADSVLIGKYFKENRIPVKYKDVAPVFWKALISTEDERFYNHYGVDFTGIAGAVKDAVMRNDARGASTITQQLAKNMFRVRSQNSAGLLGYIPGLRILISKSKEWIIAIKLEMIYDKNDILTMYANTVDFGNNAYGIKTAARTYFNTTPAKLTAEQAAVLVGMLKATTSYNPILHPKASLARRNTVLYNLLTHKELSREQYDSISRIPLKLDIHTEENYEGKAQYFRGYIANYLKDWCKDNGYDLYSSGLKIYTTIDTRMQAMAEAAARKEMARIQKDFDRHWRGMNPWRDSKGNEIAGFIEGIAERQPFYKRLVQKYPNQPDSVLYYLNKPHKVKLFDYDGGTITKEMSSIDSIRYMVRFMHCSMVAMEPETRAVRAWVGDVDFNTWKYDKVVAERQPGSTFKLFVYSEAMNQGLTPCDKRRDEFISMQVLDKKTGIMKTWTPSNANGRFSGDSIPLHLAFAQSINSVAVRLGQEMGIKNIIHTAQEMGIKSPLDDEPSLALGSSDVNLLEMADAYSTVAAYGEHREPVVITRILDQDGNEVYVAPKSHNQALPYKTAIFVQQLLKAGLTDPSGTSRSLNHYIFRDTDWGGKTGTTNNHSDAWYFAVSPKIVVGAWVGGEYRSIHFRTGALGQGSKTALPIVGEFIYNLMRDKRFQGYHAKWQINPDEGIDPNDYNCPSTVIRRTVKADTSHINHTYRQETESYNPDGEDIELQDNETEHPEIEIPSPPERTQHPNTTPEKHSNGKSPAESSSPIKPAKKPKSESIEWD